MYFKPRIFISSLLKGKIKLRENIQKIFQQSGYDVLVYENNLTPSCNPYTYRKDILCADFVLFILDEKYGTKTPSGLSGLDEELSIALRSNIKFHVYIKNSKQQPDEDERKLIEKISKKGISYYLFKNQKDLISRIKSTLAGISNEISLSKFDLGLLSENESLILSFEHDYKLGIFYISFLDFLESICKMNYFDLINVNPFYNLESVITDFENKILFTDMKLHSMFVKLFNCIKHYSSEHSIKYTSNGVSYEFSSNLYGDLLFSRSVPTNPQIDARSFFENKIKQINKQIILIKKYLQERKMYFDILKNNS